MFPAKLKHLWFAMSGFAFLGAGAIFAQAPDPPFPSLLGSDGARHRVNQAIYLGSGIDKECDAGSDREEDDGIQFLSPLTGNRPMLIEVHVSRKGYLNGWIDLNGDGDWDDSEEHLFRDALVNAGKNRVRAAIQHVNTERPVFARFRYCTESGLSYKGMAPDGEVEDYELHFVGEDATEAGYALKGGVIPADYCLGNNYPNPFNPETLIPFQLKEAGHVRLDVYNIKGEHVRTLVNDHRSSGHYLTAWNGTDEQGLLQGSGTFLVHYRVNGFSQTRRIEFLK